MKEVYLVVARVIEEDYEEGPYLSEGYEVLEIYSDKDKAEKQRDRIIQWDIENGHTFRSYSPQFGAKDRYAVIPLKTTGL